MVEQISTSKIVERIDQVVASGHYRDASVTVDRGRNGDVVSITLPDEREFQIDHASTPSGFIGYGYTTYAPGEGTAREVVDGEHAQLTIDVVLDRARQFLNAHATRSEIGDLVTAARTPEEATQHLAKYAQDQDLRIGKLETLLTTTVMELKQTREALLSVGKKLLPPASERDRAARPESRMDTGPIAEPSTSSPQLDR